MERELGSRAHAIFSMAMDLEPSQRRAMVARVCEGNLELEMRVERLLKAAEHSEGFLESPALADASRERQARLERLESHARQSELMPEVVGNYLVVGVLGAGGMATVYEAIQENPHRRVALKVMHETLTRTDAIVRFRLEAQTLARLQHPGIAQIYEAGAAKMGQPTPSPFFAMELIADGVWITRYAKSRELNLRARMELMVQVCEAVLHGHQNGVIHRDLKPANVLVGPRGEPKVIDFGIARSTERGGAASLTAQSDARKMIGTLNYMSPEQCNDPASVDVRSDVYSLGVMLYELVTGRLPHDLSRCTIPRAVQIITQEQAVVPSKVGGRVGVGSEAGKVDAEEIRGDLDAIIMKAIEKEHERRYNGAGELAADLRRYLSDLPVEARAPGVWEQVTRLARRNKPLAWSVAASAALLVVGVGVSGTLAYVADGAKRAALARERELEIVTGFQESLLGQIDVALMGDRLRANLTSAVEEAFKEEGEIGGEEGTSLAAWNRASQKMNFTSLAVELIHENVLKRSLREIETQFATQPVLRARLLFSLAQSMNAFGLHADALSILETSLQLRESTLGPEHEQTLETLNYLGSLLSIMAKHQEGVVLLERVYEVRNRVLGAEHPLTLQTATSLGGVYRRMGRHDEARQLWTQTLGIQRKVLGPDDAATIRTLNNIGVLHAVEWRLEEAEACWREVVERRRRTLGEDDPVYLGSLQNLGMLLKELGKFDEARGLIEQALASDRRRFGDLHTETLLTVSNFATFKRESGDLSGAEVLHREAWEGRRKILGENHEDTLRSMVMLGEVMTEVPGQVDARRTEGERMIRAAHATMEEVLGKMHPDTIQALSVIRDVVAQRGDTAEALRISDEVLEHGKVGLEREPAAMGQHISVHGKLLTLQNREKEGVEEMLKGYEMLSTVLGIKHPLTKKAAGRVLEWYNGKKVVEEEGAREVGGVLAQEMALWEARAKGEAGAGVE